MKPKNRTGFAPVALAAVSLCWFSGCAGNGYITSSISTGIGLDVSENPKTQVPHVKFGYIRNQLYYIPTGKTAGANGTTGSAAETPDLVSEIFVNSKFMQGITVSEKFAIGKAAVASDASTVAFASSPAQQVAASLPMSNAHGNADTVAQALKAAVTNIPRRTGTTSTGPLAVKRIKVTSFDVFQGDVGSKIGNASPSKIKRASKGTFELTDKAAVTAARKKLSDKAFSAEDTEEGRKALKEIQDALDLPD